MRDLKKKIKDKIRKFKYCINLEFYINLLWILTTLIIKSNNQLCKKCFKRSLYCEQYLSQKTISV